LKAKSDELYEIKYYDFDSLYPSVNFDGEYMLGHPDHKTWYYQYVDPSDPRIGETDSFGKVIKPYWTKPEDMVDPITGEKLKGFLHVEVEGPRGLRFPVIFLLFKNF
jgi:hypothetical protein